MKIEKISIGKLKAFEGNAKQHPRWQIEQIKASINQFGFCDPIGIWSDNTIIEGHGRYLAMRELGATEVEVIRLNHLTDAERRAYMLAHNSINLATGFDNELLNLQLEQIESIDMSAFGFDKALECLDDISEDEVVLPDAQSLRVKTGDLWLLGEHRLICGDSTDSDTIRQLMNGQTADLFLTDPPYNVDYEGRTKDRLTIANDKMSNAEYYLFLDTAFRNASEFMKKGAAFYVWIASAAQSICEDALMANDLKPRQQLIWDKSMFVLGRQDYQWKHEPCLYGWKSGAPHYFIDDRTQTTVMAADKPAANAIHPTMKPVKLIARLIANSSRTDDIVLDVFAGAGSTLIAAEQLQRKCYACEIDETYASAIVERWEKHTGKVAVKCTNEAK